MLGLDELRFNPAAWDIPVEQDDDYQMDDAESPYSDFKVEVDDDFPQFDEDGRMPGLKGDEFNHKEWQVSSPEIVDTLDFSEEEKAKSLYSCTLEFGNGFSWSAYAVRTIKLKDVLLSSDSRPELRLLAYESGMRDCGVFDSLIILANSSIILANSSISPLGEQQALYALDMRKPDVPLKQFFVKLSPYECSRCPLMVKLDSKLYSLFCDSAFSRPQKNMSALYAWNEDKEIWEALPQPPFFGVDPIGCHTVVGSKLLLFLWFQCPDDYDESKVFCFDPKSAGGKQWRRLRAPYFCFPSQGTAFVVNHRDTNVLFYYNQDGHRRIGIYTITMSCLDDEENKQEEFVKLIGHFKLPDLPHEFIRPPDKGEFVQIGGNKLCFVSTALAHESQPDYRIYGPGKHKCWLVAIPFQFDIQGDKNFTLKFMPPRISEYTTEADAISDHTDAACFLL